MERVQRTPAARGRCRGFYRAESGITGRRRERVAAAFHWSISVLMSPRKTSAG